MGGGDWSGRKFFTSRILSEPKNEFLITDRTIVNTKLVREHIAQMFVESIESIRVCIKKVMHLMSNGWREIFTADFFRELGFAGSRSCWRRFATRPCQRRTWTTRIINHKQKMKECT